ncbi:MAG: hypothetical protein JSR17_00050 [Proteobacteria bacterium]|nr:hypothetical protein [Pseudomonadota bacterium]
MKLEQLNKLLEQVISYFENNPGALKEQGLLRLQGDDEPQFKVLENLSQNPASLLLDEANISLLSKRGTQKLDLHHNILGVLKKAMKDPVKFDTSTFEIIKKITTENFVNPEKIIDELVKNNKIKAAKFLHNLLYLGTLIAKENVVNKMTAENVAVVINPQIGNVTGDFKIGFNPASQQNLEKIISEAIRLESHLTKPFDLKVYSERQKVQDEASSMHSDTESVEHSPKTPPAPKAPAVTAPKKDLETLPQAKLSSEKLNKLKTVKEMPSSAILKHKKTQ